MPAYVSPIWAGGSKVPPASEPEASAAAARSTASRRPMVGSCVPGNPAQPTTVSAPSNSVRLRTPQFWSQPRSFGETTSARPGNR